MVLARNHALEHLRAANLPRPAAMAKLGAFEQPALFQDAARGRGGENRKQLRKKIEALSTEEKRVLEFSCFEGLPVAAIAAKAGKSLNEVKAAIASALEKLNAAVAKP
jgi:DNA-directed RNA polymerase specialized sigma24 family protein